MPYSQQDGLAKISMKKPSVQCHTNSMFFKEKKKSEICTDFTQHLILWHNNMHSCVCVFIYIYGCMYVSLCV